MILTSIAIIVLAWMYMPWEPALAVTVLAVFRSMELVGCAVVLALALGLFWVLSVLIA